MSASFPREDRDLFKLLIDHHLDSLEDLSSMASVSKLAIRRAISQFCERYECGVRVQILDFEKFGLHPFFVQTENPFEHPYLLRRMRMEGTKTVYLSLCVTPEVTRLPLQFKKVYPIKQIYAPSNNIGLLYEDQWTISYIDDWLLVLREKMVRDGVGDIVLPPPPSESMASFQINRDLLEQFRKIYLHQKEGRLHYKYADIVKEYPGMLSSCLDLKIPEMVDYIIILDKVLKPDLFAGAFIGRFPITELFKSDNAIVCRVQIPELNFAKLHLMLFSYLVEICDAYLWLMVEDQRFFNLEEQWKEGGGWQKFKLPQDFER